MNQTVSLEYVETLIQQRDDAMCLADEYRAVLIRVRDRIDLPSSDARHWAALKAASAIIGEALAGMRSPEVWTVETYWEALGRVPTDDDGNTMEWFEGNPIGTRLESIWDWMEWHFGCCVYSLLYPKEE